MSRTRPAAHGMGVSPTTLRVCAALVGAVLLTGCSTPTQAAPAGPDPRPTTTEPAPTAESSPTGAPSRTPSPSPSPATPSSEPSPEPTAGPVTTGAVGYEAVLVPGEGVSPFEPDNAADEFEAVSAELGVPEVGEVAPQAWLDMVYRGDPAPQSVPATGDIDPQAYDPGVVFDRVNREVTLAISSGDAEAVRALVSERCDCLQPILDSTARAAATGEAADPVMRPLTEELFEVLPLADDDGDGVRPDGFGWHVKGGGPPSIDVDAEGVVVEALEQTMDPGLEQVGVLEPEDGLWKLTDVTNVEDAEA